MALHQNLPSMLNESLSEMLFVAKYCIEFHKDEKIWFSSGCYGYPAVLLLLSIVDSIGSYVYQTSKVEKHFEILNDPDYYGLDLSEEELRVMYVNYRNLLSHNTVMATNVGLKIDSPSNKVLEKEEDRYWLNLIPLHNASVRAVTSFLDNPSILNNNRTLLNIYKKH